jgi:hypothetical protein
MLPNIRSFIVANMRGHEQYKRNMATGASNAALAVILIHARKGVLTQARRHSFICSLLGICPEGRPCDSATLLSVFSERWLRLSWLRCLDLWLSAIAPPCGPMRLQQ